MSTRILPFAIQPGQGKVMEIRPVSVTVKADTRDTKGSLTVLEFSIEPKEGPALHTHLREDELWYVIEGDFRFKAGDAILRASAGGMAFGPRGTPHCFQNVGDAPGRLLVITTPSGLERFFEQLAALLPGPVEPEQIAAVGRANWIDFVGPPVGVTDPLQ